MPRFPFRLPLLVLGLAALALTQGCTLSRAQIRRGDAVLAQARPRQATCARADHCAQASPLLAQARRALAQSTPQHPRHYVTLLANGEAALAARINLVRAARTSIDVQTYIWADDDVGNLMLDELLGAARRGVKVRILADQLSSFGDVEELAQLARSHANLRLRLYNPTFDDAETSPLQFVAGVVCCFFKFNQRMHDKVIVVDGAIGITGGRNYQDRYFGWDPEFDYRDRDVMVGGPAAAAMVDTFDLFWNHPRSKPLTHLRDVNRRLRADGDGAPGWRAPPWAAPAMVARVRDEAEDPQWLGQHLLAHTLQVGRVDYFSDLPAKTDEPHRRSARELTRHIMGLVAGARHQVVMQTPYLVLSHRARDLFERLHQRADPPRVIVSSNSLASTDDFVVYAMSYKHKKRYLRDYGFEIYELKPHPADTGATLSPLLPARPGDGHTPTRVFGSADGGSSPRHSRRRGPAPLTSTGVRIGLHAKSLVIDGEYGMVGSHNFDPRSDHYNTESGVIVYDRRFAAELRSQILRDTQPKNAWTIAPRQQNVPVLSGINAAVGTVSEHLPLFDFWPFRYATSYDLKPGCKPLAPSDPDFFQCYAPVGDFPGVALPFKTIYTRLITAFGVGLTGIL
ncbi:MAG TPA: phospholipase D family protein [Rhodanobacteraceae bacterium]|nr:phospholipase D family protein [Rhodanobacteraceae bacterium]